MRTASGCLFHGVLFVMADNSAWVMGQRSDSIRCLLLPMAGCKLLLPSVSVAEVLPYASVKPERDAPEWMLGMVEWRFVSLPLISFEVLAGESCPEQGSSYRVAVFHTLSKDGGQDFYGVLMQGIPHIIQVRESELTLLQSKSGDEAVLSRVEVQGQLAVIPNLEIMEGHANRYQVNQSP